MQENGELIREINELRRELHAARKAVINASSSFGRRGGGGRGLGRAGDGATARKAEAPAADAAYDEEDEELMVRGFQLILMHSPCAGLTMEKDARVGTRVC